MPAGLPVFEPRPSVDRGRGGGLLPSAFHQCPTDQSRRIAAHGPVAHGGRKAKAPFHYPYSLVSGVGEEVVEADWQSTVKTFFNAK